MIHRITLIGSRGCGKSTIGRLVAARLAWPFIDADHEVERQLGVSIAAYFASHGEAAFRDAETAALQRILADDRPLVLATGGGAVLRDANRQVLAQRGGTVVFIDVPVAVLQERLRHASGGRPSLTGGQHGSVADELPAILAVRDPLYRAAAHLIQPAGAGQGPAQIAELLCTALAERGVC